VDTYTHGHAEPVLRSHRWRTADNSAAHLLPHLRAGLDVLDVGCGPGTITVDLARRVAPGRVLGPRRLARPARRGARAGRAQGVAVEFT
jgi:SAM-dependent methyltransferase